ncbi:hypothetical protein [Ligilactobacillus ruminis]|uniref:hypothetical protein n=1 Tax=Ligilactobacillus ruminis TaxID=1623 RepID=UPI001E5AEFE4|nr:hypothetical protein [Ligilactobacillus ruminis]
MAAISRKMTAASLLTDAIEILRQSLLIKRNAGQGSRFKAAFVRHFFNFDIWEQTAFAKCSAAKHLSDQRAKTCSRVTGKTALFEIYARKRQTLLRAHAPFPDVFLNMNFLLSYQAIIMHT